MLKYKKDDHWLFQLLDAYIKREPFDVQVKNKVNPAHFRSALHFVRFLVQNDHLTFQQVGQILSSLGICAAGLWMIRMAIFDPEPTSKLFLLVGGGVALTITGSLSLLKALGLGWRVRATDGGMILELEPNGSA